MKQSTEFSIVQLDDEIYLNERGQVVTFTKFVTVLLDGEEQTHKLSYTREIHGVPTEVPVPCLRVSINGGDKQKLFLDGVFDDGGACDLEVANDCVVVSR